MIDSVIEDIIGDEEFLEAAIDELDPEIAAAVAAVLLHQRTTGRDLSAGQCRDTFHSLGLDPRDHCTAFALLGMFRSVHWRRNRHLYVSLFASGGDRAIHPANSFQERLARGVAMTIKDMTRKGVQKGG